MKELTLREIQLESLEILKDVHSFCEVHGIKYSLAYGTLIGAVRHNGFVPWDDDIDIVMKRSEYEKFCSSYRSDRYNLICKKNDKTCMMAFAKVCDMTRTLALFAPWTRKKVGIGIDVFPLDNAEDDFNAFAGRYKRVSEIWMSLFVNRALQNGLQQNNGKKLNLMIKVLDFTGLQVVNRFLARKKVNKMSRIAMSVSDNATGHYSMMVFCDDGTKSYYDKKDLEEYIKLPFEGSEFYCFKGYDGMLSAVFGDYMQLPPLDKRVPSHDSNIVWR